MIWIALGLGGCTPEAGEVPDTDGPPPDDTGDVIPDDTGTPPDDTGGEDLVCGPDDIRLAEATFCAPDFTLPDHLGNDVTRSDYEGGPLIVEVIGMWCGSCRITATEILEPLYAKYADDDLQIITMVVQDISGFTPDLADAVEWRESMGLSSIVVADVEGQVTSDWDRGGVIPMSYLLDQDGVVTWFANGNGTWEQFDYEVGLLVE